MIVKFDVELHANYVKDFALGVEGLEEQVDGI
jgi:hypothetical protein